VSPKTLVGDDDGVPAAAASSSAASVAGATAAAVGALSAAVTNEDREAVEYRLFLQEQYRLEKEDDERLVAEAADERLGRELEGN
jgi:hypothetical protein